MFPVIDRKLATIIGIVIFLLGFVLFPLNKYKDMMLLRREYPTATKALLEAYENYILQKENLEKIQVSLDRSLDTSKVKMLFPQGLSVKFDEKKHLIYAKGSVPPSDVYRLIKLVTTTSNLRFKSLTIENPIAVPITVFSLNMSNTIHVECVIEYLEVRR